CTSVAGGVSKYLSSLLIFFSTYSRMALVTSMFSPRMLYFIKVSSFHYVYIILCFPLYILPKPLFLKRNLLRKQKIYTYNLNLFYTSKNMPPIVEHFSQDLLSCDWIASFALHFFHLISK